MKQGAETGKQLRGDRGGGIPWITILDSEGTELVTSDGPKGNIGCPVTESERSYFLTMIEKTLQHAPEGRIAEIAAALDQHAEEIR